MATPLPKSQGPSTGTRVASVVLVLVGAGLWLGLAWLWAFGAGYLNNLYVALKFENIEGCLPKATAIAIAAGQAIREYQLAGGLLWVAATLALAVAASHVRSKVLERWPTTFALLSLLCAYLILAAVWVALLLPLTGITYKVGRQ